MPEKDNGREKTKIGDRGRETEYYGAKLIAAACASAATADLARDQCVNDSCSRYRGSTDSRAGTG